MAVQRLRKPIFSHLQTAYWMRRRRETNIGSRSKILRSTHSCLSNMKLKFAAYLRAWLQMSSKDVWRNGIRYERHLAVQSGNESLCKTQLYWQVAAPCRLSKAWGTSAFSFIALHCQRSVRNATVLGIVHLYAFYAKETPYVILPY